LAGPLQVDRPQLIPILAVTEAESATGVVMYVSMTVKHRSKASRMQVHFASAPGRFSSRAQQSIERAIERTALALGFATDSWEISLSVPYVGVTVDGDSLSGMISVCVAALAQGKGIVPDVVITGTITPDGLIGSVGAVPLKLAAAEMARLQRVIVPAMIQDGQSAFETTVLKVYSLQSVGQAYALLTATPDPIP